MSRLPKIIVIIGPTASGKTGLGLAMARRFDGEIVSADSRQVYRGMDIGTGKDLADYGEIPYHLIDVAEPNEQYDLARYKQDAESAIVDILARHKAPIVVGGSGLYLQALVDNFQLSTVKADNQLRDKLEAMTSEEIFNVIERNNPAFAAKINNSDRHNKRRLIRYAEIFSVAEHSIIHGEAKFNPLIIGLDWPKEVLAQRIKQRLMSRLDKENMVEEVNDLNRQGVSWARLESFGLEYKFISWYLQEKLDYEQMTAKLYTAICQFAKRQMTWFRRWEKNGAKIHWVRAGEAETLIANFLKTLS